MVVTVVWIVLGVIAGFLASRLFHRASGLTLDVALGIAGAFAGGLAVQSLGFQQPNAFGVAGVFGAAAGAVAMVAGYRSIFRQA
jgi:uncharacterized membrane protein YeaQ/YmgE (transglycosylase-associated protein family)